VVLLRSTLILWRRADKVIAPFWFFDLLVSLEAARMVAALVSMACCWRRCRHTYRELWRSMTAACRGAVGSLANWLFDCWHMGPFHVTAKYAVKMWMALLSWVAYSTGQPVEQACVHHFSTTARVRFARFRTNLICGRMISWVALATVVITQTWEVVRLANLLVCGNDNNDNNRRLKLNATKTIWAIFN